MMNVKSQPAHEPDQASMLQQRQNAGLPIDGLVEHESSRTRQFSLTSVRDAHRTILRACGRLVLGHGAQESLWASHMERSAAHDVALDLSCVNELDARGLGVLATLVRHARQHGRSVSVIAASRVAQRIGELTGLDRALRGAWNSRTGVSGCDDACPRAA